MQGFLYPEGAIGQALQAVMLVWGFYESKDYLLPNRCNPPLLKATSILLLMFCLYGIPLILFNPGGLSRPHYYLQSLLASFLPLFMFYKYIRDGYLTEKRFRQYIILFLIVSLWKFEKCRREMITQLAQKGLDSDEITNNAGYIFLTLMPVTFFFYKKPLLQYVLLLFILSFILLSMKRGVILISAFCLVYILYMNIKTSENKKHKYISVFMGVMVILVGTFYISYQLSSSDYFRQRIEETKHGKSSGRDKLYSHALDLVINDNSIEHLLIGRGAQSTRIELGKEAHQDWLETAMNNGLFGVSILTYFCIVFLKTVLKKNNAIPKPINSAFIILYFIFIAKSMFSMSLQDMPCFQTMMISFCVFCKESEPQMKVEHANTYDNN